VTQTVADRFLLRPWTWEVEQVSGCPGDGISGLAHEVAS
jgi:hypothetical protein